MGEMGLVDLSGDGEKPPPRIVHGLAVVCAVAITAVIVALALALIAVIFAAAFHTVTAA
jgi:hypothetical protein